MKRIMTGVVGMVLLVSIIVIAVTAEGDKRIENDGSESQEKGLLTIGFSQVGAESDWRTADSISIKQTFTPERGYDLLFEDAKQKQSNQIMAIRRLIQQEVDYIVFLSGGRKRMGYCIGRGKTRRNPGDRDRPKSIGKRYRSLHCVDRFEFLSGRAEGV